MAFYTSWVPGFAHFSSLFFGRPCLPGDVLGSYRGNPFAEHSYVDTGDDSVVTRLAELFNSDEARRHLWHEALKLSTILFAILGTAALLSRNSLNWDYPSPANQFFWTVRRGVPGYWFWPGLFGCLLFAFLVLVSDYYRWCLKTWAKRETVGAQRFPERATRGKRATRA